MDVVEVSGLEIAFERQGAGPHKADATTDLYGGVNSSTCC